MSGSYAASMEKIFGNTMSNCDISNDRRTIHCRCRNRLECDCTSHLRVPKYNIQQLSWIETNWICGGCLEQCDQGP